MSGSDSWLVPALIIGAAVLNGPWARGPVVVPVAHETAAVSCEVELRKQLDLRDQLEWYRLALAVLGACAWLLLGLLAAALCGCRYCPLCFPKRRASTSRPVPTARKGDASVLALLAAQEVRH